MNEQEAIDELRKIYIEINDCGKYPPFEVAFRAIEKQIPKKPNNIKSIKFTGTLTEIFKTGDCPFCGDYVDSDDYRVCDCGQKLEWG